MGVSVDGDDRAIATDRARRAGNRELALAATLVQVSSDPFTNSTSQHKTQVEPDTFSYGNTAVIAFQSGRFFDEYNEKTARGALVVK